MSILALLVLLLSLSGPALAQNLPVVCGDLPEADCQLLKDAQAAALNLTSASFDFKVDLTVENIPDAPFEALTFVLTGDGAFAVDPALKAQMSDLQKDPAAVLKNMDQMPQLIEDMLNGVSGELNLQLTLPGELIDMASADEVKVPETLAVKLVMVDGNGYINLDDLATALPTARIPGGWFGVELARTARLVLDMAFQQMGDLSTKLPQGMDFSAYAKFSDPSFIGKYMTMERLADDNGSAVFHTTLDYTGLLTSPELRDMLEQQMKAMGSMSGETMSEDDLDEMMTMLGQMYQGLTLEVTQKIDLETKNTTNLQMNFAWDMSEFMKSMESGSRSRSTQAAPVFTMDFNFNYADFDSAPAITAPEGVKVMTAEEIMQMLGPSMSPGAGSSK